MAQNLFCWRCDSAMPMLTEQEWRRTEPALHQAIADVQRYRQANECSLSEALHKAHGQTALTLYCEMTGFAETNVNAIWHHRVSLYGPPCPACSKHIARQVLRGLRCVGPNYSLKRTAMGRLRYPGTPGGSRRLAQTLGAL